ncbi:MAG: type II toxin-antitoxin system RelE/ParE family toxin [Paludisphaera borealis]|uniref:type II toxin-antitoxin system RelE/ParE family toxin n=1 Tax=Paludisphaera borealis TaxID=1387353 RepID=UPI00284D5823|nr:type II toxin-antitoxin system RelE/ParE family toxin [Paludisphaera borealis]MDR3622230.1 type II toxin-antitoxin system RelE/ParE family toxin [Paludisphaera borealis]
MSLVIHKRPASEQDLDDVFYHYLSQGSIRTARRFLAQTEATFQRLARMPSIGTLVDPDHPTRPTLRYMPVSRFRKYVVFYLPILGGIDVIRVLHGARDLESILDAEFD